MDVRVGACVAVLALAACGHQPRYVAARALSPIVAAPPRPVEHHGEPAPLSRAADAQMIEVARSRSIAGSTPEERDLAYDDWAGATGRGDARAHGWFDREEDRHIVEVPSFRIDLLPVTNAAYAEFVADGGAPAPTMDAETWAAQGFQQDWATEVERFVWKDERPPPGREDHPVVLVGWDDAAAYCAWRGLVVGAARRLPGAHEFEKAARGSTGLTYPWGPVFERDRLNSADGGPRDTVSVGEFPGGVSPTGVLELAGNVFQWTATRWPTDAPATSLTDEMTVKGSAWDDHAGLGRGAAWHGRPRAARHVIVGFRCAADD